MIEQLKKWMESHYLDFKMISDEVVEIEGAGKFFIFNNEGEPVFDEDFALNLSVVDTSEDELIDEELNHTIYKFGDIFYYTANDLDGKDNKASMTPLQSVGKAFLEIEDDYTHLGVHGHRELLNGSGQYDSYAKKAKFFGHKALGIAEKNTLAGTLIFQQACKSNGIKPVLGMGIDIIVDGKKKGGKVYAKNDTGWKNLLNISNVINHENVDEKAIQGVNLLNYSDGVIFVFDKDFIPTKVELSAFQTSFDDTYYQLDTTEYSSDAIDGKYLSKTKEYLDLYGKSKLLKPILLSDSYYVHDSDHIVKKYLNMIDIGATHLQSKEQSFRPLENHLDKLEPLFKDKDLDFFDDLFDIATANTMKVAIDCDYEVSMDFLNMPEYELTIKELTKYGDKYRLFDAIVESNWNERVPEGMDDEYQVRLDEEFRVINENGFLDYFLINWDWLQYCKRNNIYVGVARGSAGGSVLSYLLGVTHIDPIKYDLLFERFLNEGRLKKTVKTNYVKVKFVDGEKKRYNSSKLLKASSGYINASELKVGDEIDGFKVVEIESYSEEVVTAGSPPDIDSDVESSGRQAVKEYLEERYGKHRVFSIGTFTSLGIKSAISDTARMMGIDTQTVKTVTKMVTQKEITAGFGFSDFFAKAMHNDAVKKFIIDFPELMEIVRVVLGNSKSPSVHAAGVVITPKYDKNGSLMNAWDWTPMKIHDDQMVSEWEGQWIEASGLLKLDLLGTTILDKIHTVIKSVKKVTGEDVDFYDIYTNQLEDEETFEIFTNGFTQNVFQFAGGKMTKFIQSMEPTTIEDIYAANALFRPATMNLGYHEDYVEMKHGRKEVVYDWGLEEITKETYGIMVYQEQMMKAVQAIGGFSLQEADAVRKAMGKKKQDLMDSYKGTFVKGAVERGCDELEAIKIWNKIEQGASYGFNKCISGNEKIYRVGTGGISRLGEPRFNPTIEEMYKVKNSLSYAKSIGKMPLRSKYLRRGYGSGFSLNSDNKLIKNKIVDIRYEGVREVYEMTLLDGKTIKTTSNHKFPTSNGEKILSNISVDDDKIYINIGYVQEDTSYRFTDREGENNSHHNDINQEKFIQNSMVEHMGFVKKGLHTELVGIKSIKLVGKEDVYDVEMENPHHTFATQGGIVTCNSHAAAYGLESYVTAYLKAKYPVHFYTMSLEFGDKDTRPLIISEITDDGRIEIAAPNVNTSGTFFATDYDNNKIYWALNSIKMVGDVATKNIVDIRETGGDYESFDDFVKRTKGHKVNKTTIVNLILAGAFDEIENLGSSVGRYKLIKSFFVDHLGEPIPADKFPTDQILKVFFWNRLQNSLSGLGNIEYRNVYNQSGFKEKFKSLTFLKAEDFHFESKVGKFVGFAATLVEIRVMTVKKTQREFAKLTLQCNDKTFSCVVWMDQWDEQKDRIKKNKGGLIVLNGKISADDYSGGNQLSTHKKTLIKFF